MSDHVVRAAVLERIEQRLAEALNRPAIIPQWFTISDAASYCRLSEESVRKLVNTGMLTARRPVKGRLLISRIELDDLIRNSTSSPRSGRGRR